MVRQGNEVTEGRKKKVKRKESGPIMNKKII